MRHWVAIVSEEQFTSERLYARELVTVPAGPADELKFKQVNEGHTIALEFEYRTRTNAVPVNQMTHHIRAIDRMRQHMLLSISWVPRTRSSDITYLKRPRGPLLWASAGFAGFMFVLFRFLKSRRNSDDYSD